MVLKNGILSKQGWLPRGRSEWDDIIAEISESIRKVSEVHSHTFEMEGLYLGTGLLKLLMVLRASGDEQIYLRSVFRNKDKLGK